MRNLVCEEESWFNQKYNVVIKFRNSSFEDSRNWYKEYPFLKKYFLHIHYAPIQSEKVQNMVNLKETLKMLESRENGTVLKSVKEWDHPQELLEFNHLIIEYICHSYQKSTTYLINFYEVCK